MAFRAGIRGLRARASDEAGRARSAGGFTLIELLVSIAIIGASITVLVSALATSIKFSDIARRRAAVEAEARKVAEALRSPSSNIFVPTLYLDCLYGANALKAWYPVLAYIDGSAPAPSGITISITSVKVWDNNDATPQFVNFAAGNPSGCVDTGLQQITVRATAAGTPSVYEEVTIVKRRQ